MAPRFSSVREPGEAFIAWVETRVATRQLRTGFCIAPMMNKELLMNKVLSGLVAGFAATIVLSILMLMKQMMGVMPQLDVIAMLGSMLGGVTAAWGAHFFIGTVAWGILFAYLARVLPGAYWMKGVVFASGAWLMMMIILMPMADDGLFGLKLGLMAPVATLMLHMIFGAQMGWVYGALHHESRASV